jgi:hypothetical protein
VTHVWLAVALFAPGTMQAQPGEPVRVVESVLFPLAYRTGCWASIVLQNASNEEARFQLAAHRADGSIVPFQGPAIPAHLAPGERIILRLQPEGEEGDNAWVQVRERIPGSGRTPAVAVSGSDDCLAGSTLSTEPAHVVYPSTDPWLAADVTDLKVKTVWVLNTSEIAASATVCYSNGVYTQVPDTANLPGAPVEICSVTESLYLPPFALKAMPVVKDGNSQFSLRAQGESIVIYTPSPPPGTSRRYSVDSTVTFGSVFVDSKGAGSKE